MNDSNFHQEASVEASTCGDVLSPDDAPRFGAVDIVEAFTALRHELRGQTREGRALAELIQSTAENLQSMESKLLACVADRSPDDSTEAKQFALLIVETDHQFSRAVAAIAQWESRARLREAADDKAIDQLFAGMNRVARWFASPLMALLSAQRSVREAASTHAAIEGLDMVVARLRRMMRERGIERIDVEKQPFDANSMHAIGTMESTDCPAGCVAEQLSPAYRWRGKILRFADVRVAK